MKRSSLRDHEQKPGGETRQIRGYKDKEGVRGGGHLSLMGKAHGRAVTRWWKGAGPERGKSRRRTNATHQMIDMAIKTPDRAWEDAPRAKAMRTETPTSKANEKN